MIITVHLSDGRKITKDENRLRFFSGRRAEKVDRWTMVDEGFININIDHVIDMRPAEDDEIEHAKIHGW